MNWLDLTILVVLTLFGLRGFFRGFFREVFSLAGLAAGFVAAATYEPQLSALLARYLELSPLLLKALAFVAIFFAAYFFINLAGWLLHRSERLFFLKTLNRTGGVAIGLSKGAVLAALAVFLLASSPLLSGPTREKFQTSYFADPLSRLAEGMIRVGKEKLFAAERASLQTPSSEFHL